MNKQDALRLLQKTLAEVFLNKGFTFKKAQMRYVRGIAGGRQSIGVPFYDFEPEFEFSLVTCIRLDDVEQVLDTFLETAPKYRGERDTTVINLEHFVARNPAIFKFSTENDLSREMTELAPIIEKKIIPFLDTHRDIHSLDMIMNRAGLPIDTMNHPYRGMHGILLAQLIQNPHIEELVGKYQEEMRQRIPLHDQHKFDRFVDYLRKQHPTI